MQAEHDTAARPRGRRAGQSTTRDAIRAVALEQFAHQGYGRTSMRSVAAAAGVDPSLLTHFFGNKEGLFAATFDVIDTLPAELAEAARDEAPDRGRRLATRYLGAWEDTIAGARLRGVARAASESPSAAAIVRRTLEDAVLAELPGMPRDRIVRVQAALAQLLGVAVARHALAVAPFVDLDYDELVSIIAPAVEATLGES